MKEGDPYSTLIVGNGKILRPELRQDQTLVDEFPTVVRLNDFKIKGHELTVGCKTDIHVCHWAHAINNGLVAPGILLDQSIPFLITDQLPVLKQLCDLGHPTVVFEAWEIPYQALPGHAFPSTGLSAIYHFLLTTGPVSIIGFDSAASGHYWKPDHKHSTNHSWEGQKNIIAALELAGLVRDIGKPRA